MDPFLTKTVNDSGVSIFHAVCTGSGEGGNVVISPAPLNFALATACAASENATRDELRELLRHRLLGSDHNDRKIHELYMEFSKCILSNSQDGIKIGTGLWVDQSAIKSEGDNLKAFGRQMAAVFGTQPCYMDGPAAFNEWASDVTGLRINRMVHPEGDDEVGQGPLLLSSICDVKAKWASAFDPFNTWPGEFYNDSAQGTVCQMMHQKGVYEVAYLQDSTAVTMPCGASGGNAVTFILPNFGTIDDAVREFSAERWQTICKTRLKQNLRLFVPKFRVSSSTSPTLKEDLVKAGLQAIFSPDAADLDRIGETGHFWVGDVIHKAVFEMDEAGSTPVAGVQDSHFSFTCVGVKEEAPSTEFRLNRPFLFVVHHGDAMIQIGKVVAPLMLDPQEPGFRR